MKMTSRVLVLAMLPLISCDKGIDLSVDVRAPCDQADWLTQAGNVRVSVEGNGLPYSRESFRRNDSHVFALSNLPLVPDLHVTVEAWTSDEETRGPAKSTFFASSLPMDLSRFQGKVAVPLLLSRAGYVVGATDVEGHCVRMGEKNQPISRYGHTMTFIPKIQKVLIVGGAHITSDSPSQKLLDRVELFDPITGQIAVLPPLAHSRAFHTATLLPDGRVFVVGGFGEIEGRQDVLRSGALIDVTHGTPQYEENFVFKPRAFHTATLINEKLPLILIAGGCSSGCKLDGTFVNGKGDDLSEATRTIEIFDAKTGSIFEKPLGLNSGRLFHTASMLPGERVLILGGINAKGFNRDIEIYDHATHAFHVPVVGGQLPVGIAMHAQAMNNKGDRIVIAGGYTDIDEQKKLLNPSALIMAWDEKTGAKVQSQHLISARSAHLMMPLNNDRFLVIGGDMEKSGALAEKFCLDNVCKGEKIEAPNRNPHIWQAGAILPNQIVLQSGGYSKYTLSTCPDISAFMDAW